MINIAFGPYTFGFRIDDKHLYDFFKGKFKKHLTQDKPDLLFDVEKDDSSATIQYDLRNLLDQVLIEGDRFSFFQGIIKGEFISDLYCSLTLKKEAFNYHRFCIFDMFLTMAFYYLERFYNHEEVNRFISHASAVSRNGKGLVFAGPSKNGKTTVVSYLDTGRVLHDEAVLLSLENREVSSTPLSGKFP